MTEYVFALAGNPNSGKTTLFNALTGSSCKVGNWSGVTVERKEGVCRFDRRITIVDLPGIYSLTPASAEETAARDYIANEKPDLILNIVDSTRLARNLYLTTQLAQTKIPMVIALNMTDALEKNGISLDAEKFSQSFGITAVPISAGSGAGINELIKTALAEAEKNVPPVLPKFKTAAKRYDYIGNALKKSFAVTGENKQERLRRKIDALVTHPLFALPLFAAVMLLIFKITFGAFGAYLSGLLSGFFGDYLASALSEMLLRAGAPDFLRRLAAEGILAGVGGAVSFFPQIIIMFFLLSLLEASGYMARTAFILDKPLRKIGLGGKSAIALLMGFGCSVPALMAARTLGSERDRRLTMLLVPFVSCGAKMPVYSLIASALFREKAWIVIACLYFGGMLLGALSGIILSKTVLKGKEQAFVLELPPYRLPTVKSTLRLMWEKTRDFAVRAATVLLFASAAIWLFRNLDFRLRPASEQNSILGVIGGVIAPLLSPCGFGSSRAAACLISGFAAKEAVVSTMMILYGADFAGAFTPASGLAFLTFILLYPPCAAALATMRAESDSIKFTLFSAAWQLTAAWLVSAAVYNIGNFFL